MADNGHSNLGPSSAERWFNCPGSVALAAKCPPSPASIHAAEGTVAHDVAEKLVSGKLDELDLMAMVGTIVKQDGYDIEVSDEMVEGAIEYRDIIKSDTKGLLSIKRPANVVTKAEVRVCAKTVDANLWGTADYLLYRKGHKLVVYDYKFGKGVAVEADENKQMAIYAVAAMDSEAGWAFDEVELVIVQPRAPHVDGIERRWKVPKGWLLDFRNTLVKAVQATADPKAPVISGAWCRWCPAKAQCPAMFAAVQEQAKVDFSVVPKPAPNHLAMLPDTRLMPVEKLAAALDWEDAINSWYEALRLRVREILESGGQVPGYKLVDGKSNRKWVSEDQVVAQFGKMLGDKLFESKLLSPAKLEKIVGKGKLEELGLTMKPEAPKSVAKDTDPRPVARSSAAEDFGPISQGEDVLPQMSKAVHKAAQAGDLEAELLGEPSKKVWP